MTEWQKAQNAQGKLVPSNALAETPKLSSQALVLARMLETCATIQGRDLLPGESRVWEELFGKTNPEKLTWAFKEHLRTAKWFPKPGEITELLDRYAAEHPVKPEDCTVCRGSGWVIDEANKAKRCECRKAVKQ